MKFTETPLKGAFLIELEARKDDRGMFARVFCKREFEEHGINPTVVNTNMSRSRYKGTLRGMHFQKAPYGECKLVRCTRGSLYDVIIDLRQDSPSYMQWYGVELTQDNDKMLFLPEGFAHGFLTLSAQAEVQYKDTNFWNPKSERTIKWDDSSLNIDWPITKNQALLSEKDAKAKSLKEWVNTNESNAF